VSSETGSYIIFCRTDPKGTRDGEDRDGETKSGKFTGTAPVTQHRRNHTSDAAQNGSVEKGRNDDVDRVRKLRGRFRWSELSHVSIVGK